MSETPEDFDKLLKAMRIAKYEVPPPGYFKDFSTKVVCRIEREKGALAARASDGHLFHSFLGLLENNPAAAAAFGFVVCGFLIAGIAYSEYQEPSETAASTVMKTMSVASDPTAETLPSLTGPEVAQTPSFKPSVQSSNLAAGFFNNFDSLSAKPVNFNGN